MIVYLEYVQVWYSHLIHFSLSRGLKENHQHKAQYIIKIPQNFILFYFLITEECGLVFYFYCVCLLGEPLPSLSHHSHDFFLC